MVKVDDIEFKKVVFVTTSGDTDSNYGTIEFTEEKTGNSFMEMGITNSDIEYLLIYPTAEFLKIDFKFMEKALQHVRNYIIQNKAPDSN